MTRKKIKMSTYKAEIELIDPFKSEFSKLIPEQRRKVDELMNAGLIVSYALAMDRSKLWIVFEAKNLEQVYDALRSFPLYDFMRPDVFELAFTTPYTAAFRNYRSIDDCQTERSRGCCDKFFQASRLHSMWQKACQTERSRGPMI